jgi:predicted CoA-binding protein
MKTLVIGASERPSRYAHKAVKLLREYGHEVVATGVREGRIDDVAIQTGQPAFAEVDTVTLYVGPQRQDASLRGYVIGLKPRRVIFNPGTENPAFAEELRAAGIGPVEACTLVMLRTGQYA